MDQLAPSGSAPATDLLRFLTCGSVDDGKSTLIGRLLHDADLLLDDQVEALTADSLARGTAGPGLDFALLLDGLQAEREQGITIDVAYRYFATGKRSFIVADTPGHEQYTRNMVTGASTADLAVILVDARKGMLPQTRRHATIACLLGIRHLVLAVNKMDLVGYAQAVFDPIAEEFKHFASGLGATFVEAVPVAALAGDNVTSPSSTMPWYRGPSLLALLETVQVAHAPDAGPFRMPVQLVQRPDQDFRGFAGTVVSGRVSLGDEVVIAPSRSTSRIARILGLSGDAIEAQAGQAVTLTLADEVDVGRGDIIAGTSSPPTMSDQLAAYVIWMDQASLLPERQYIVQVGLRQTLGQITEIKHRIDVNSLEHHAAKRLELNDIAFCNLALDQMIAFDPYEENRGTGSFIIIDRYSNATVGAGMIKFGLRRAENLTWQQLTVQKRERAGLKRQAPCVLWFTGLSGAGKSTIANLVEKRLYASGLHTYMLDGDNLRHGLNRDLGFTAEDRVENVRRAAEVAHILVDAGLIVLVALISPFRSERQLARSLFAPNEFVEIFVDTPLAVCMARDPKGLYRKARDGKLVNMTGVDSPYEAPTAADLTLHGTEPPEAATDRVITELRRRGILAEG